jgi:hypothetical protein
VVKRRDLLSKHSEDGVWRVAGFEFGEHWMGTEILFGLFLVRFQGVVENVLII